MTPPNRGNYISEWFGHRIYPKVVSSKQSVADQRAQTCPFLTKVKGADQQCVKNEKSKGVCTISSFSNGPRQDWVACPYRILDPSLVDSVGRRLYGASLTEDLYATAAPTLREAKVKKKVRACLANGGRVLVYFDHKIGGEVSVAATQRSPEMAFDVTLIELLQRDNKLSLGRFGILEVQTMDFHGSYGKAVGKLRSALELHPKSFPAVLQQNHWWAGDGIEGPNIANVFKRTFYQMMFKFSFGQAQSCAGTVLTIPASVWDSWRPFLAAPQLVHRAGDVYRLSAPDGPNESGEVRAWIYVVDIDASANTTPSPIGIVRIVEVTAGLLAHLALTTAPKAAADQLLSTSGIYATLLKRLREYWPDEVVGP